MVCGGGGCLRSLYYTTRRTERTSGFKPKHSQMSSHIPEPPPPVPPTLRVIGRDVAEMIGTIDVYRRYVSNVHVSFENVREKFLDSKKIIYRVGARSIVAKTIFREYDPMRASVPQAWNANPAIVSELVGTLRKESTLRSTFETCDLSGVMQVLGRAVAYYANTGTLNCNMMRSGKPINITTTALIDFPVPNNNSVFIPRTMAPEMSEGVFAVLAAAVNSFGVPVVTDRALVSNINAVMVNEPTDATAFHSCWLAARALLAMAHKSGAGGPMSVAFVAGIHDAMSVVAHTDEGGVVRDILRGVTYNKPRGFVWTIGWRDYAGLADLSPALSLVEAQSVVDSVALLTAAESARADPLVENNGKYYPSVFAAQHKYQYSDIEQTAMVSGSDKERQSVRRNTQRHYAKQQRSLLQMRGWQWCKLYATQLAKSLCTSGETELAAEALQNGMLSLTEDNRHICHAVIAPWYWIEPTTLIHERDASNMADIHGYGVIAPITGSYSMPVFEHVQDPVTNNLNEFIWTKWRSARTSGLVVSMLGRPASALEDIAPRILDENGVICEGGNGLLAQRLHDKERLNSYLWKRGSCWVPAPAELLHTGPYIGFKLYKRRFDMEGDIVHATALPATEYEISGDLSVVLKASRPSPLRSGAMGDLPRSIRRLVNSGSRNLSGGGSGGGNHDTRRLSAGDDIMPITTGLSHAMTLTQRRVDQGASTGLVRTSGPSKGPTSVAGPSRPSHAPSVSAGLVRNQPSATVGTVGAPPQGYFYQKHVPTVDQAVARSQFGPPTTLPSPNLQQLTELQNIISAQRPQNSTIPVSEVVATLGSELGKRGVLSGWDKLISNYGVLHDIAELAQDSATLQTPNANDLYDAAAVLVNIPTVEPTAEADNDGSNSNV